MWPQTKLTEMLQITYPLIQAPMAGGATTPHLVAAVSNSGGLGSLGAGYMTPAQLRQAIREIRALSNRPFAVNLFAPESVTASPEEIAQSNDRLQSYRRELGLTAPAQVRPYAQPFAAQIEVVLEEAVPVFSFTFGLLPAEWMEKLKTAGVIIMGTATTVTEAIALEKSGVDVVIGQGSEAGGHRGTFIGSAEQGLIGTMALVPQLVDHLHLPVVAAGGLMDGRGLVAALALGATGVQMGTAFLTCVESGAHPRHKEAILQSTEESTVLTRLFSGRHARGIQNRFITEMRPYEETTPPYPVQNKLTRDIRRAAAQQDRPELMSLWAGQGTRLNTTKSAAELVTAVITQAEVVLQEIRK